MFGWKGRFARVSPRVIDNSWEIEQILQQVKGVAQVLYVLGLERLTPSEFERIFDLYQQAGEYVARFNVGFIILGGTPVLTYMGYERGKDIARKIEEKTGVPTRDMVTIQIEALKRLSVKKLVLASPYEKARNEERKALLETMGFQVLAMRGAGTQHAQDPARTLPYASFNLAMEAFREAPEADAIYISCPGWEVVEHIDALEKNTRKPVVSAATADVWAALSTMHLKQPIKGYGKLLEEML